MSQSRPARDPPAKRPPPVDPPKRSIGRILTETSFGTNEEIWDIFVRVGLIPAQPTCPKGHGPLRFAKEREMLHFSLLCSRCRKRYNVKAGTHLQSVNDIRLFLATLQGWCYGDMACSIKGRLDLSRDAWINYKTIFMNTINLT